MPTKTDEEIRELQRAALAGDPDALEALKAEWQREPKPDPEPEPVPPAPEPAPESKTPPFIDLDWDYSLPGPPLTPQRLVGTAIAVGLGLVAVDAIRKSPEGSLLGRLKDALMPGEPEPPPSSAKKRKRRSKRR